MPLNAGPNPPPLPIDTPLVETDRHMVWFWVEYFTNRDLLLQQAASQIQDVILTDQAAAIGATPLDTEGRAGLYRLNVIARVTRAGTVSSSLQPTFRWTTGGVPQSRTYTALTGNTTTTMQLDTFPVRVDGNTSITYETAYATVGATDMQYSLEIGLERLG